MHRKSDIWYTLGRVLGKNYICECDQFKGQFGILMAHQLKPNFRNNQLYQIVVGSFLQVDKLSVSELYCSFMCSEYCSCFVYRYFVTLPGFPKNTPCRLGSDRTRGGQMPTQNGIAHPAEIPPCNHLFLLQLELH